MLKILLATLFLSFPTSIFAEEYLGQLSDNPFDANSISNPFGYGSPFKTNGLNNPYSEYGSPYSNKSWSNPYATDAPAIFNADGNYRGKLSSNVYDPDSISNPFSQYSARFQRFSSIRPHSIIGRSSTTQPRNPTTTQTFSNPYDSMSRGVESGLYMGLALSTIAHNRRMNKHEKILHEIDQILAILNEDEEKPYLTDEGRKYWQDQALKRFESLSLLK